MTILLEETVKAFQEILRQEYGHDVSFAEAAEAANMIVGYFDLLAKIYHRQKTEESPPV